MAKRRRLKRYRLSMYRLLLRRQRLPAFLLGILLFILGTVSWFRWIVWPEPPSERWLLGASLLSLLYWLFTLVAPALAYVQPRHDRIRLQTPFYRLNISYRRIRNTRPVDIAKAFPPGAIPRGFRRSIRRFYGMTALGLDLSSWPLPRWLLALLLGRMILAPDQPGLILITRDWIELSKQVETMLGAWTDEQRQRLQHSGTDVSNILHGDDNSR
jgi:hypothetical protein